MKWNFFFSSLFLIEDFNKLEIISFPLDYEHTLHVNQGQSASNMNAGMEAA
jgi:hypothetical protein